MDTLNYIRDEPILLAATGYSDSRVIRTRGNIAAHPHKLYI